MNGFLHDLVRGLVLASSMCWTVLWALVLGFTRSAIVRVLLSREQTERNFGDQGLRAVALAAVWGVGSFATSYAAVTMARTLFKKHGSLLCALVFMFASTNMSTEFILVLWLLMGGRVVLLEVLGGVVFIAVLSLVVRGSWPADRALAAHERQDETGDRLGMDPLPEVEGETLRDKLTSRRNWATVADAFVSDWRRTWWQLLVGFVLAGLLAVFIPRHSWEGLQAGHTSPLLRILQNALAGPLVAIVTGIPSVGNLPLARLLDAQGLGLSGVMSFVYADLLALPLLLLYREHFGLRTAAYVVAALLVSAVAAGVAVDLAALAVHLVPRVTPPPDLILETHGGWRYPTLLNIAALVVSGVLVGVRVRFRCHDTAS